MSYTICGVQWPPNEDISLYFIAANGTLRLIYWMNYNKWGLMDASWLASGLNYMCIDKTF